MRTLSLKLVLLFSGILLGLLVSEAVLRMFVEQHGKRLSVYDSQFGWRGRPHGSGVYTVPRDNIRARYQYNNYGFRDEDIVERTADEPRVVLLGDSFLECLELPYDQIYHELVERELQATLDERSQVIALGAQGYSNAQELLAFRKYGHLLGADVVVSMFFTGNDFEDNQRKQYAYLDADGKLTFPQQQQPWHHTVYMHSRRWVYENSHLVFLAKNLFESRAGLRLHSQTKSSAKESDQYKRDITRELLAQTRRDAETRGARYGVVVIPSKKDIKNQDFAKSRLVTGWCREWKVPVLDLSEVVTVGHYFHDDGHFNREGQVVVADQIVRYLVQSFELQSKTPSGH